MIALLSPAKTLDFEENSRAEFFTLPRFTDEACRIMQVLKKKNPKRLMQLQSISQQLAELNYERNQIWQETHHEGNAKQAISAFKGDVYIGLNEADFSENEYLFAQDHLRILSGLYGVLRPLDIIQPYRLEMSTSIKTSRGHNLYEFWKTRIAQHINEELTENNSKYLINLASEEYFKAVHAEKIRATVITFIFQEERGGKRKIIGLLAKRARGKMARFIVKHRIWDPELLKAFDEDGYHFDTAMSTDNHWYFVRHI